MVSDPIFDWRNALDLQSYYTTNKIITRDDCDDFYWKIDAHHNAKGYEVMSKASADKTVASRYLDQLGVAQHRGETSAP